MTPAPNAARSCIFFLKAKGIRARGLSRWVEPGVYFYGTFNTLTGQACWGTAYKLCNTSRSIFKSTSSFFLAAPSCKFLIQAR